jgi:hypothetical protein
MNMRQKGFISIAIIIGIIVVLSIAGYFVAKSTSSSTSVLPKEDIQNKEDNKSGISGTVLVGPQCPTVGPGLKEQCTDEPLSITLAIMQADAKTEVSRFTSNAAGEFRIAIPAGDYRIISLSEKPFPYCNQPITVEAGEFIELVVHCDSGIR